MADSSRRSLRVDLALMVLWGVLCSAQFFVRGEDSYIRPWDNADSNHPIAYATSNFPTNSPSANWGHFALCGRDGSLARFDFYALIQKIAPGWLGFVALMILQRVVASVFMYLFVKRSLGLGRLASVSAGFLYPFCVSLFELGIYHGLAEPGIPMFAFMLGEVARLRHAALIVLLATITGFLFGRTTNLFIAQPFIAPTFIFTVFVFVRPRWRASLVTLLAFSAGVALADAGTAAAFFRAVGEAQRLVVRGSLQGPGLIGSLNSAIRGEQGLWGMFIAAGPLLVLCVTVVLTRLRKPRDLRATLVAFVFCCVGSHFLNYFLMRVLGLSLAKAFALERFYVSSYFFLTVLAAMSINSVVKSDVGSDSAATSRRRLQTILLGLGLTAAYASMAAPVYSVLSASASRMQLRTVLAVLVALLVALLAIGAVLSRRRLPHFCRRLGLILLPTFAVLLLGARLVRDLQSPVRYRSVYNRAEYREVARRINQQGGLFRVGTLFPSATLMPLYALPSGLETVDGYFSLYPKRYHFFWRKVIEGVRSRYDRIRRVFDTNGQRVYLFGDRQAVVQAPGFSFAEGFNLDLLSLAGCRYLFSEYEVTDSRLSELQVGGSLRVYENQEALPRFFLVSRTLVFADSVELLDSLASSPVDVLRRTVFLESHSMPPALPFMADSVSGTVTVKTYRSDRIELSVECESPVILVVTNNWSRFWKCRVDGREQPVFPADFTFQCVSVAVGRHAVQLSYEP